MKDISASRADRLSKVLGVKQGSKAILYAFIAFWVAGLVVLIVIGVLTFLSASNQIATRESTNFPESDEFAIPGITLCDNGKYNLSGSVDSLKVGLASSESLIGPTSTLAANASRLGVQYCLHFNTTSFTYDDSTDAIIIKGAANTSDPGSQLTAYFYSASVAESVVASFNPRDARLTRISVAVIGSSTYEYSVQISKYINPPHPPLADTTFISFPGTVAFITAEADPTPFGLEVSPTFEEAISEQYQETPSSAFYLVFSVVAGLWSVVTGMQEVLFPMKFPEGQRAFRFGGKCSPADMV